MSYLSMATAIPYAALAAFCRRHHLVRMWLYGSVLRADFSPTSDIDVLVEFDPDHIPGWEFYGEWAEELAALFGRPVDLTTVGALRPWLKQTILATRQVVYERDE